MDVLLLEQVNRYTCVRRIDVERKVSPVRPETRFNTPRVRKRSRNKNGLTVGEEVGLIETDRSELSQGVEGNWRGPRGGGGY